MSGKKRDISQVDDNDDNDQPQSTKSASSHTSANSQQGPTSVPGTSPGQGAGAMSTPTGTQPATTPTVTNGSGSIPGNSSPSNAPAKTPAKTVPAKKAKTGKGRKKKNDGDAANDDGTVAKRPRKRRRKGDPEPDHTAAVVEKSKRNKRVGQACDRCHLRRFKCDENNGGCYMCLRSGYTCVMTNRVTKSPYIRGGGDGEVIDFDKIQNDNVELKEKNEQLNQDIEQLRTENGNLRNQLQYYQNFTSSIGATSGPNNAPVSLLSGNFSNPHPQVIQQPNPHLYNANAQPFPANYNMNNNAFSGNMSTGNPPNLPHLLSGTSVSNALPFPQWAQPNLSQGLPVASQNTAITYPPIFYQVPPHLQAMPFQNINNQGMGYQGVPAQNFQYPSLQQVPGTQYLPGFRPLGSQSNTQNQNNPPNQPTQTMPAQRQPSQPQNANTQNQNNTQGQGAQAHATQNQNNQSQTTTNQSQGMRYPRNQVPQNQNLQPLATQYPGSQIPNTNVQNQGMGNSSKLNQDIPVPNTQGHNTDAQNRGFQYPNIQPQPQPQNTNTHQDFLNARLAYQTSQPSLFGSNQNQGTQYQFPQGFQRPSFQFPGAHYPDIVSQGLGTQFGYMNTQNQFPQGPGPLQISNPLAEESGGGGGNYDADGESESDQEYSWTPPPRAGGQYVFPNLTNTSTQPQQTNTEDINQGEHNAFPSTTVDTQTQQVPTATLGEIGNPFDFTNININQSPDLPNSEMQRLLKELEAGPKYDYNQETQDNGDNND